MTPFEHWAESRELCLDTTVIFGERKYMNTVTLIAEQTWKAAQTQQLPPVETKKLNCVKNWLTYDTIPPSFEVVREVVLPLLSLYKSPTLSELALQELDNIHMSDQSKTTIRKALEPATLDIQQFLVEAELAQSYGEAGRLIKGGAVRIEGISVTKDKTHPHDYAVYQNFTLSVGKKKHALVVVL